MDDAAFCRPFNLGLRESGGYTRERLYVLIGGFTRKSQRIDLGWRCLLPPGRRRNRQKSAETIGAFLIACFARIIARMLWLDVFDVKNQQIFECFDLNSVRSITQREIVFEPCEGTATTGEADHLNVTANGIFLWERERCD